MVKGHDFFRRRFTERLRKQRCEERNVLVSEGRMDARNRILLQDITTNQGNGFMNPHPAKDRGDLSGCEDDRMRVFRSLCHRPIKFQPYVGSRVVVDRDGGELSGATGAAQPGAGECKNNEADLVHLVYLVCLVYPVCLVGFVQLNSRDRPNRQDRPDRQGSSASLEL